MLKKSFGRGRSQSRYSPLGLHKRYQRTRSPHLPISSHSPSLHLPTHYPLLKLDNQLLTTLENTLASPEQIASRLTNISDSSLI
ncbi:MULTISPECIES: hypothetical protein [unclassified Okeania]|uniref:hypothetical protein n=1 Tax=unclassified Okeania TaxID=2634635 RepID=UPI0013BBD73B|nr:MULTISPECIES: hypothetical protein [unclassified Okeania]NET22196.1 hypothetical protein [Okeania sp. SIO1H5]NET75853.1 hypothetical protein [Okeania sp. SIO1F9]NET93450.1 hypothetical protein [Okeania sp. SIO1H2]